MQESLEETGKEHTETQGRRPCEEDARGDRGQGWSSKPGNALSPWKLEDTGRILPSSLCREHHRPDTLISDSWLPEVQGNTLLSFRATRFVAVCYSGSRKLVSGGMCPRGGDQWVYQGLIRKARKRERKRFIIYCATILCQALLKMLISDLTMILPVRIMIPFLW